MDTGRDRGRCVTGSHVAHHLTPHPAHIYTLRPPPFCVQEGLGIPSFPPRPHSPTSEGGPPPTALGRWVRVHHSVRAAAAGAGPTLTLTVVAPAAPAAAAAAVLRALQG